MKLTIERNDIWRGIDTILDAVASKPAQPVLSNILVEAEDDRLTLSSSDLDLSMRTRIPANVQQPGRITVPARTLAEIAREWPEAQLTLSLENGKLAISGPLGEPDSGEGKYVLATSPPDEFPEIPETLSGLTMDFGHEGLGLLLQSMIEKTSFAVSRDETRPVLNGVFWRMESDFMAMAATDGSRLAEYRHYWNGERGEAGTAEVILPPQLCSQLTKLLDGPEEIASAIVGENQVLFDLGTTQVLSRLIEGPYVDYEQVVPRENDKRLSVGVDRLLPAVRRVSILSSTFTHQVRLALEGNSLELTASSQEVGGEGREVIPAEYDEEPLEVAYNSRYLMEILRKVETPNVVIELRDSITAAVLKPEEQPEGGEFFYLLMPMRPAGS